MSAPIMVTRLSEPMAEPVRGAVMSRIAQHDAKKLNAIAEAVLAVQGYTPLSVRYSIAILALEALDPTSPDSGTGEQGGPQ